MTGAWPKHQIDHRDLNSLNNRWGNLRAATQSQNQANKPPRGKSGVKGVFWHAKNKKWFSMITKDRKNIYLGTFDTIAEAAAIYALAAKDLHGEFARVA